MDPLQRKRGVGVWCEPEHFTLQPCEPPLGKNPYWRIGEMRTKRASEIVPAQFHSGGRDAQLEAQNSSDLIAYVNGALRRGRY